MSDPDFEEQLRQEEVEKEKLESGSGLYTDSDGTVYEWNTEKKAWFPKIDDDFIARYQMNYGAAPSTEETTQEETSQCGSEATDKEYEQYWKDYYNYYYYQQQQQVEAEGKNGDSEDCKDGDEEGSEAKKIKSSMGSDNTGDPYNDDYFAYYSYYYGQGYTGEGDQSGQGEAENTPSSTKEEEKEKTESKSTEAGLKRKPNKIEGWFDHDHVKSTHVYVSGLPPDITDEEYKELMNKCGLVMFDPFTKQPKLKLYKDAQGQPKGDGLCCYIKHESVELAMNILDGYNLRGHRISVEMAKFEMKGKYDPTKKKKRLNNKDKRKLKERQEKLFDWRPELPMGARSKWEKTVILKNMFDPKEFEEDPMLINELRDDIRAEASKFGNVQKVTVYDRHPDGVASVTYKEVEEADQCVTALNGRWFAQKRVIAQNWDGKTKYEIEESQTEREKRLKKWETFLDSSDSKSTEDSDIRPSVSKDLSSDSKETCVELSGDTGCASKSSMDSAVAGTDAGVMMGEGSGVVVGEEVRVVTGEVVGAAERETGNENNVD